MMVTRNDSPDCAHCTKWDTLSLSPQVLQPYAIVSRPSATYLRVDDNRGNRTGVYSSGINTWKVTMNLIAQVERARRFLFQAAHVRTRLNHTGIWRLYCSVGFDTWQATERSQVRIPRNPFIIPFFCRFYYGGTILFRTATGLFLADRSQT